MKPFKKVLAPIDFSTHSDEAIRVAAELSRRFESELTIVHVYDPIMYVMSEGIVVYPPAALASLLEGIEKGLAAAKANAIAAGAVHVETKTLQGRPVSEIVDLARNGQFDLIVMGTHGRTGIKHAVIGSVAERVVRHAACPVLTTRAKA